MFAIHYYTQSFPKDAATGKPVARSLQPLLDDWVVRSQRLPVTLVLYLSSLHVGTDPTTGAPYLHLNDDDVQTLGTFFDDVQQRCTRAVDAANGKLCVECRAMLGGAGGAYTALFADYAQRYPLVRNFCRTHCTWLRGLDLDIEEPLDDDPTRALDKACTLIRQLHTDVPTLKLTMAPVAFSLTDPSALGMGNFSYHTLVHDRPEGTLLDALNVQAYGCFTKATFDQLVHTGYDPSALVFGMLGDDFSSATDFARAMTALHDIRTAHPTMRGAILWEYGDSNVDPVAWGEAVWRAVQGAYSPVESAADSAAESAAESAGSCVVV